MRENCNYPEDVEIEVTQLAPNRTAPEPKVFEVKVQHFGRLDVSIALE